MTLDYVSHWDDGGWSIIRELVSNAMDSGSWKMSLKDGVVTIEDDGNGLDISHLLFGKSEKEGNARGQFGEGLKLALLALTRHNLTAQITSGHYNIHNHVGRIDGMAEDVLAITWEECHLFPGTRITIPNWPWPLYAERFIQPGDPRVVYTSPTGSQILREESPSLYVRDVWVCPMRKAVSTPAAFGYNLNNVEMNRDRTVADSWSVTSEMGNVWGACGDYDLLTEYWSAVKLGLAERLAGLTSSDSTPVIKKAFYAIYGHNTVMRTNGDMAREAEYRGAKVLDEGHFSYALGRFLRSLVGTDTQYIREIEGQDQVPVPDSQLNSLEKRTLRALRRIVSTARFYDHDVRAFVIPGRDGFYSGNTIGISRHILSKPESAISTALHEMAHARFDTPDATADHVRAVSNIAAQVIAGYALRR
jgi:hypothetical protein